MGLAAVNNVPLGLANGPLEGRTWGTEPPLLLTLDNDGAVVGAAVQTPPYNLARSQMDPGALPALAAWLRQHHEALPGVMGPVELAETFAAVYLPAGISPSVDASSRLFELREVSDLPAAPGSARLATADDLPTVLPFFEAFRREASPHGPLSVNLDAVVAGQLARSRVWLWSDRDDVPVCMAVRNREMPSGASIGPVYTPDAKRGRGYATSLVTHLSRRILADKDYACLFTDLSNPISNSIYPKIGYRPLVDTVELRFG